MRKKLLIATTLIFALAAAKAQSSDYGGVDSFSMANPDLGNRAQYAGRPVNPNYLLINWSQQTQMDQRMISNGFVRLGISSWEDHNRYGGGIPQRDLAVSYARLIGADIVIYATMAEQDPDYGGLKTEHSVWFYAKEASATEVRRAAPSNAFIPNNTTASMAMNRLQDALGKPHVKGGVWYNAANDTYNWIGPKFGRRMSEPRVEFLTEVGPYL